jgi:hypothetical protein
MESVEAGRVDLVIRVDDPGGVDVRLVDFPADAEVLATRGARMGRPIRGLPAGEVHRLRGLVPGAYLVLAQGGGHAASARVEVRAGVIAEITLKSPGVVTLTGRVTEFPTGQPVAGLLCQAAPEVDDEFGRSPIPSGAGAKTDAQGRFELAVSGGDVVVGCRGEDRQWMATQASGHGHLELRTVRFQPPPYEGMFGLYIDESATVGRVVADMPAQAAGIQPGDVIRDLDGASVDGLGWLVTMYLHLRPPGTTVRFGVLRGGGRLEIPVTSIRRGEDE